MGIGRDEEPGYLAAMIVAVAITMFGIVLSGVPTLADNEARIAAYVTDVQNGNWICPNLSPDNVASKPPLLPWLVALTNLPFDRLNRFSLYFPSAVATLLTSLLLFRVGRSIFGWGAGFFAAMCYLLSPVADMQMQTGRYDGLFTLPVTMAAIAAFQAWTSQRSWIWFWLASAAATLVKGPLGVVLAAGGLLAVLWEKRSGDRLPLRGSHWLGVAVFLLICGGWFLVACAQIGQPLLDKLFGDELLGHAVGTDSSHFPFERLHQQARSFFHIFAPWSVVACFAFWRIWRHPSPDAQTRRFERFLCCWFFFGLLIFSAAAHQRSRLIFPLVPPAALLAGRELAEWARRSTRARIRSSAIAAASACLLIVAVYHHGLLKNTRSARQTAALRDIAQNLRKQIGLEVPVHNVNVPFAFSFYLNGISDRVSPREAAALLNSDYPVVVAVSDFPQLQQRLNPGILLYDIVVAQRTNAAPVRVVSNVPQSHATNSLSRGWFSHPYIKRCRPCRDWVTDENSLQQGGWFVSLRGNRLRVISRQWQIGGCSCPQRQGAGCAGPALCDAPRAVL
jgi:4-amino-4-deoxy-L-arabinose transferase-like glycosyltransferase